MIDRDFLTTAMNQKIPLWGAFAAGALASAGTVYLLRKSSMAQRVICKPE